MTTEHFTLKTLVDRTLSRLVSPREFPYLVELGGSPLTGAETDRTCTLRDASRVAPTDVLEFGEELLLVSGRSSDAVPVLTVVRGYMGSPVSTHLSGDIGFKDPRYPRWDVTQTVRQALSAGITSSVPAVSSETFTVLPESSLIQLPDNVFDVIRVQVLDSQGRLVDLSRWDFIDFLPAAHWPSGKGLQINTGPGESDVFWVTYTHPYTWLEGGVATNDPTPDSVVEIPSGAVDLPVLWTAATLATGRELSRTDFDRVEEWSQEQAVRQGVNLRLVRELWGEFYRRVDEVKKTRPIKRHRPFQRMRGF